ncbi:MAG: KH domain-containing protein [Patescibacteria group bacterium]|nr:KH domain-containing protein [Patescibacteria group bacterium]
MRELLEYIVKSLVSKPEKVEIQEETIEGTVNFNLTVDSEDMGVVIGKAGQTIRSIRRLLVTRALAEDRSLRVNLNLQEVK